MHQQGEAGGGVEDAWWPWPRGGQALAAEALQLQ